MVDRGRCELCGRIAVLHRHHIIPKVIWRRLKRKRRVKGNPPSAGLCLLCSRQVHALFNETELAELGSIEELKKYPVVKEYIKWVRRFGAFSYKAPPKLSRRVKQ